MTRGALAGLAVLAIVAATPSVPAQTDITEANLQAASQERRVRVGSLETGRWTEMPLELYVARVLAGEGEPNAADAAREALAVAIRTYTVANAGRHARDGYDLCDSTHCQVLRSTTAATRRVTLATAGRVLSYQGQPAAVFYSASCGGQTENANEVWPGARYPYLQSFPDDVHEDDVEWTLDLSLTEIEQALRRSGFEGSGLRALAVERRNDSGRVALLRLSGLEPPTITGPRFRAAIGATRLRSTAFSIGSTPLGLRFTGRGYGHGVGMCVIGAGRRALRGETADAILTRYYPGLDIVPLDSLVARGWADRVLGAATRNR